ncbi:hypothetical protein HPP92_009492 [Vanilla planifolia]|uniref:Uncharacterized protein n=1 Tax=Vanilla planifolia TaxID=51239 RepID=A0A835R7Z7_VANPL|nr:hypothetical protein HPP92_009492 [Vanilla planifolia]
MKGRDELASLCQEGILQRASGDGLVAKRKSLDRVVKETIMIVVSHPIVVEKQGFEEVATLINKGKL